MRKTVGASILSLAAFTAPFIASAATLFSVLNQFSQVVNILTYLLIAAAILFFFWGLVEYLMEGGEMKALGLMRMVYGIIALFVMVSVWGLIQLVQGTFGVTSTTPILPSLPTVTAY